jgi:site-specific recombinase XerD
LISRNRCTSTVVGLRDRALIALLIYTFARVSAALHMDVEDYHRVEAIPRARADSEGSRPGVLI